MNNTDIFIYGRIFEVTDQHVLVECIIEEDVIELREFDKSYWAIDLFKGNCIKLHFTSGLGWMQMDVHQLQKHEMHHVAKLLTL